jgi:predicted alpha/beta superfamily hydrolase
MRQLKFLLLILSTTLFGQTNGEICIGKKDSLYSNILKENRQIVVYVPQNENPYVQTDKYPVLYLLDGDILFTKTIGMLDHLSSDYGSERCPKMIVVGIINSNRFKDLLPITSKDKQDSIDDFTKFMEKELIPYIDKKYPTQQYRTLLGHSLGGLRSANTLVYQPQVFNSYIALDPSLGHDMNVWSDKTYNLMKSKTFNNKSLYLAMAQTMSKSMDTSAIQKDTTGWSRHMRSIMRFAIDINTNKNKGLNFNWKYYPNLTHGEVTFEGAYDGLKSIFSWYYNEDINKIYDNSTSVNSAVEIITKKYDIISSNMGLQVLPPESSIMKIIDVLLSKGMKEKAVAFADLNVKNYPQSEMAAYYKNYALWGDKKLLSDLLPVKTAKEVSKFCLTESKLKSTTYNISETAINELAYQLLQEKKLQDALVFFKTNTELYPKSANVYDGYGECLLAIGKEKEGLAAYKKSLALNPNNINAASVLQRYNEK